MGTAAPGDKIEGAQEPERLAAKLRELLRSFPELRVEKAIIFGSRVRGDYLRHSDLDVILVSDAFASIPFPERASRIPWDTYWTEDYPLELLCYTPEELERKRRQIGTVREALEHGVVVDLPR